MDQSKPTNTYSAKRDMGNDTTHEEYHAKRSKLMQHPQVKMIMGGNQSVPPTYIMQSFFINKGLRNVKCSLAVQKEITLIFGICMILPSRIRWWK